MPDRRLIPRALWKIAAIFLLGIGVAGGILWLGDSDWSRSDEFGNIIDLESGSLFRFYCTLLLFLTTELSFLIFWYRSQSRKDFSGRYRIWGWAGCFWGIVCLCTSTGLHLPMAELALARWPLDCWRPLTAYWLTPLAVGYIATFQLLALEMRQSRLSRGCWTITFWWGVLAGLLHFGLESVWVEATRIPIVTGVTMGWHVSLVTALLVHARFVVHVTNEAAPKELSWSMRMVKTLRRRMEPLLESLRARRLARQQSAPTNTETPEKDATSSRRTGRTPSNANRQAARKSADAEVGERRKSPTPVTPEDAGTDGTTPSSTTRKWSLFRWRGRKDKPGTAQPQKVRLDSPERLPGPHVSPVGGPKSSGRKPERSVVPLPQTLPAAPTDIADDDDANLSSETRSLSKKERRRLRKMRQSA